MQILNVIVFSTVLTLAACDNKSSDSKAEGQNQDVATAIDDPALCEALANAKKHEAPEGYTAAAKNTFYAKVDWSSPLIAGELNNSASVTFISGHGDPLALTLKSFKLFMPAMGHGTIKADKLVFTQKEASKNVWSVGQIYFSMGGGRGEWVVDIEATACGYTDTARVVIAQEVQ
jgi:hypothetical protein